MIENNLIEKYISLLLKYKSNVNIIGTKKRSELSHIIDDSIINLPPNKKVLDLGCGAGIPGVPLKVKNPTIKIYFLDKSRKKINILRHILLKLNIDYQKCLRGNTNLFTEKYRNYFDIVVSRGMGNTEYVIKKSINFLSQTNSSIYLWKSKDFEKKNIEKKKYNIQKISQKKMSNCKIIKLSF